MLTDDPSHTIATTRLIALPFCQDDYAELCQLHQDPRVMATLGGIRSDVTTQEFLDDKIAHGETYGFGYWMFRDKKSGGFIGRGGIQHVELEGIPEIEVGYTVRFEEWGKGFATEIAQALLRQAFELYSLDNIVAFTLTSNQASQRVMQKVGLDFEREISHKDEAHVLYRMKRQAYTFAKR